MSWRFPWIRILLAAGVAWVGIARRGERAPAPMAKPMVVQQSLKANGSFDPAQSCSLGAALQRFSEASQIPVHCNWNALEGAGINADAPVSVRIREGTWQYVLERLLVDAGGGTVRVGYRITPDGVMISLMDDLNSPEVMRAFPVEDILKKMKNELNEKGFYPVIDTFGPDPLGSEKSLLAEELMEASWHGKGPFLSLANSYSIRSPRAVAGYFFIAAPEETEQRIAGYLDGRRRQFGLRAMQKGP